jgi:hypothetical protein
MRPRTTLVCCLASLAVIRARIIEHSNHISACVVDRFLSWTWSDVFGNAIRSKTMQDDADPYISNTGCPMLFAFKTLSPPHLRIWPLGCDKLAKRCSSINEGCGYPRY